MNGCFIKKENLHEHRELLSAAQGDILAGRDEMALLI